MARKGEVIDTGYPGIKQRVKDGKYIVTIDLGRQRKLDKKTGEMKLRQVKTQRTVATLKEAKAIQGENNKKKEWKTVTGLTGVILFQDALQDYIEYKKSDWGISYLERQKIFEKRLTAYFGNMDVRKIDPLDVEEFFRWCREGGGDYEAISNNTIIKVSSLLSRMYQWMMKAPKRYWVTDNPVEGTDALKKEFFEGMSLSVDELKYLIGYMLKNENDSSVFVMIGLAALAGLRRGEICGLRWGDIDWDNGRIHIVRQRAQVRGERKRLDYIDTKGWK